jgi:hypothetical protein
MNGLYPLDALGAVPALPAGRGRSHPFPLSWKTNEHTAALERPNILPRRPDGYAFTGDATLSATSPGRGRLSRAVR